MKGQKNALEWSIFGVSAALFAALAAYLLFATVKGNSSPADIDVELGSIEARASHFAVPVIVTNRGGETAENLRVEIALRSGEKDVEVAELTFAFVPRGSHREAWALFRNDPRQFTLEARAVAFEAPSF